MMMLCWLAPLWAAPTEALAGAWVLEPSRSEPIEPLLAAAGASWMQRQAAARLVPEQDITISPTGETVTITTRAGSEAHSTLIIDGQPRPSAGLPGVQVARHSWEADGSLVSVMNGQAPDGAPMIVVITRDIDETGALVQDIYLEVEREAPQTIRVSRVFRRR